MAPERSVARRAFAKINLDLRVTGVRPDGYHELRTTFQSIALADSLTFCPTPGPFRILCDDPECPTDRHNLVWRAAELVWKAAGRRGAPRDVTVTIAKRIPMRGGLGGGSSDGAASLLALTSLWRVKLTRDRLRAMAAKMGADVPYFLVGGTMVGRGRGDRLSRVPEPSRVWVVVAIPGFGVSTKDAFGWWDRQAGQSGSARRSEAAVRAGQAGPQDVTNDLQTVVAKRHRVVTALVAALERHGAFRASLSGSGSAVFGLYRRRSRADRAAAALRRSSPRLTIVVTRTLTREECRKLAGN
jgi:4-diphosphocytidyl-2-C-methyl-D-erythritol kinase